MTSSLDETSAQMKLMRAFIEATVEMQGGFRNLDDSLSRLKADNRNLGEIISRINDESKYSWELERLQPNVEKILSEGRTVLEKDSFQAGLLEAPLLTEEFDNIARKLICTQIGLPRDIRGKLGRRLTAWVSELADVEDIDGIDFEDPKLSRIIALINLEDEFQRDCLDTFKRSRLSWLGKFTWRSYTNTSLMTQEHRLLMDLLSHVQSRLKEEITALGYVFRSIDKKGLPPIYKDYLDALLESTGDKLENITDQIDGYRGIVFATFGVSYFRFSLAQLILPEVSDHLRRLHERVHSLLANKLSDLADYLRDDLVDTLKTLQPDCVSPPDHEALENARCLLAAIYEAYESSAPFDSLDEVRSGIEETVVMKLSEAVTSLSLQFSEERALVFKLNTFAKLRGTAFPSSLGSLFEIEELFRKICELDLQRYFAEAQVPVLVTGSVVQLNTHGALLEKENTPDQLLWRLYRCASPQPEQGLYKHASNIENPRLGRRAKELIREAISQVYEELLELCEKTPSHNDKLAPPGLDQFRMLIYS